jgi:hypothetical protein
VQTQRLCVFEDVETGAVAKRLFGYDQIDIQSAIVCDRKGMSNTIRLCGGMLLDAVVKLSFDWECPTHVKSTVSVLNGVLLTMESNTIDTQYIHARFG